MKYMVIVVAIAAIMSFAIATDGDVEHSAEPSSDAHLEHVFKLETARQGTTQVIIGVQAAGNYIPFWGNNYNACRFMTLYLQSEIDVLGKIVTLSFMPWSSATGTYDNVRVKLCHTSATELSTTFDNNYTGNTPVEVMNVGSLLVGNAGNVWMDWDIDFDYNNTDNLLVEILWNGDAGVAVPIWRTTETVPRRLYAWDDNATTGTVGNQCYYVKLAISTGPPPEHDVGTTAINDPGLIEFPNTTLDPTATYQNFGTSQETFDVYFVIDSSETNVYNETANITLDAGIDTTISFASWTTGGSNGIVYDVTAYTVLSGDVNPANDTLTQTTTTQSAYWKTYATMPQATYYNAAVYSDVTGAQTVWSVGGYPTYTSIFEFDCALESWTTSSAVLNHEAQRTAAAACMGRIYVMGGCDAGFTAHNYAQEFDPVASTVTDVTAMPTARYFNGALTWNDTLIYVLGGQAASYYNTVEIYDPANDAWTTGTAMPSTNRSFACGIQNDTIYVAGGWNGGYISGSWIGVIDPVTPQTITWTAIADIPTGTSGQAGRSRLQGACVETPSGWRFYFTGGDDHGASYPAYDTWFYDPNTAAWVQDLDKTTPISNSQCAVYVPNPFDHGVLFCAGGFNTATSSGTNATEGLVNIGTGIQETPPNTHELTGFGFAAMANPSKGMISYATSVSGRVTLKAYDATGRLVETLVNTVQPAGILIISRMVFTSSNSKHKVKLTRTR